MIDEGQEPVEEAINLWYQYRYSDEPRGTVLVRSLRREDWFWCPSAGVSPEALPRLCPHWPFAGLVDGDFLSSSWQFSIICAIEKSSRVCIKGCHSNAPREKVGIHLTRSTCKSVSQIHPVRSQPTSKNNLVDIHILTYWKLKVLARDLNSQLPSTQPTILRILCLLYIE